MRAACEKLCKYEEGAGVYGVAWIDCKAAKPKEADEYLVMILGATKPTVLNYDPDEEAFYEEDIDGETIWHPVTHWAEIPSFRGEITPSADGYTSSVACGDSFPSRGSLSGENDSRVKRCATCRHEDKLGDEERCLECEKHNLWEERK
jgi:hypothetical protein